MELPVPAAFDVAGTGPPAVVALLLASAAVLGLTGRSRLRTSRVLQRIGDTHHGVTAKAKDRHSAAGARESRTPPEGGRSGIVGEGLRDTAMMLELIAAMLDAGAGIGRALELVAACAAPNVRASLRPVVAALAIGADWDTAWRSSSSLPIDVARLKEALGFAALTGAPSAVILYAQAARSRRERFREAEQRAAALGVKLVVPLGLCSLPAFICLGVVPVLLAMMPSGP